MHRGPKLSKLIGYSWFVGSIMYIHQITWFIRYFRGQQYKIQSLEPLHIHKHFYKH